MKTRIPILIAISCLIVGSGINAQVDLPDIEVIDVRWVADPADEYNVDHFEIGELGYIKFKLKNNGPDLTNVSIGLNTRRPDGSSGSANITMQRLNHKGESDLVYLSGWEYEFQDYKVSLNYCMTAREHDKGWAATESQRWGYYNCAETSTWLYTGIQDDEGNNQKVYFADGTLRLENGSAQIDNAQLNIYDASGRMYYSEHSIQVSPFETKSFNLGNLNPGMYIVRLTDAQGEITTEKLYHK